MNAIELYDKTSSECCRLITSHYSTGFNLGIRMMQKKYQSSIYAIYAFVRFADEIVDTFLEADRQYLLEKFQKDVYDAINFGVSSNPVLHAFQKIFNQYKLEKAWVDAYLRSMAIDLNFNQNYDDSKFHEYIHGSVEVVGLMCLKVFCEGDNELFDHLKLPMQSLFSAFQKVNFLRDMKSDFEERGRIYFPGVDYNKFDVADKQMIEEDIQKDFDKSLPGINGLPEGAWSGIRVMYECHKQLFDKIRTLPPEIVTQKRIRISNFQKFLIIVPEGFIYSLLFLIMFLFAIPSQFFIYWEIIFPTIVIIISLIILKICSVIL